MRTLSKRSAGASLRFVAGWGKRLWTGFKGWTGTCLVLGILALLQSVGMLSPKETSFASELNKQKRKAAQPTPSPIEIQQLIRQLADPDRTTRDRAYQRLLGIGPHLVRGRVPKAWLGGNARAMKSLLRLIVEIQGKYGIQPGCAKGLEFLPFGDLVWRIPARGEERAIKLGVKITNVGEKPVRFFLLDTIQLHLTGPDGEPIRGGCMREGLPNRNYWSPPLTKGKSFTVSNFGAKLYRSRDGKILRLKGTTDSGLYFHFEDLQPGRYYLWFGCGGGWDQGKKHQDGTAIWDGHTATPFVAIEIK